MYCSIFCGMTIVLDVLFVSAYHPAPIMSTRKFGQGRKENDPCGPECFLHIVCGITLNRIFK